MSERNNPIRITAVWCQQSVDPLALIVASRLWKAQESKTSFCFKSRVRF